MTVILCLDNQNGMLFNKRRQSRDKALIADIFTMFSHQKIYINEFSRPLFAEYSDRIIVEELPLASAGSNDVCFVENMDLLPYQDNLSEIILYRWNRDYPSDVRFTMDLSQYTLQSKIDFVGNSHEKLTREVYRK